MRIIIFSCFTKNILSPSHSSHSRPLALSLSLHVTSDTSNFCRRIFFYLFSLRRIDFYSEKDLSFSSHTPFLHKHIHMHRMSLCTLVFHMHAPVIDQISAELLLNQRPTNLACYDTTTHLSVTRNTHAHINNFST